VCFQILDHLFGQKQACAKSRDLMWAKDRSWGEEVERILGEKEGVDVSKGHRGRHSKRRGAKQEQSSCDGKGCGAGDTVLKKNLFKKRGHGEGRSRHYTIHEHKGCLGGTNQIGGTETDG